MTYTAHCLERVQNPSEKQIGYRWADDKRPHDQSRFPAFDDIVGIIEDDQSFDHVAEAVRARSIVLVGTDLTRALSGLRRLQAMGGES